MVSPWILAILAPLIFALMNIMDKYVMAHKVKRAYGYIIIGGAVNLTYGAAVGIFLPWQNISLIEAGYSALAGVLQGLAFYLYYLILEKEDAANMVGFVYTYPVLVAVMSYLFLGEKISMMGYLGMGLTLIGALMLAVRLQQVKLSVKAWYIFALIALTAGYEFFIKASVSGMPPMNGLAINSISLGLVVTSGLLSRKKARDALSELRNAGWAFLTEALTFSGLMTSYLAMVTMPATIFTSVCILQAPFVLVMERITHARVGKMSKDVLLLPKMAGISMIVIGLVVMYLYGGS